MQTHTHINCFVETDSALHFYYFMTGIRIKISISIDRKWIFLEYISHFYRLPHLMFGEFQKKFDVFEYLKLFHMKYNLYFKEIYSWSLFRQHIFKLSVVEKSIISKYDTYLKNSICCTSEFKTWIFKMLIIFFSSLTFHNWRMFIIWPSSYLRFWKL